MGRTGLSGRSGDTVNTRVDEHKAALRVEEDGDHVQGGGGEGTGELHMYEEKETGFWEQS